MYIRNLSPLLEHENCPTLMDQVISHLLWADDLILLALDPKTLQNQLDSLLQYCNEWGLDINMGKTKVIKFNSNSDHSTFRINGKLVSEVESYCYLGIEVHKNGKFNVARDEIKKKAFRSLYGLKSTLNKTKISFRSLTTLFDSLIKPVALYGAPLWTPSMPIIRTLTKFSLLQQSVSNSSILKNSVFRNVKKSIYTF